jgi:hypothetical protein
MQVFLSGFVSICAAFLCSKYANVSVQGGYGIQADMESALTFPVTTVLV